MRKLQTLPLLLGGLLLAAPAQATEVVTLGGPGGQACSNQNDPPTLADGVTPASATLAYAWDGGTKTLTVVVDNTSPEVAGLANPVITNLWFNVPDGAVTSLQLVGQSAAGGAPANFVATTDLDLYGKSLKAGCMGAFDVRLVNLDQGGIANPAAANPGGPAGSAVLGPVVFTFAVDGPGVATLTDDAFAHGFSLIPPGTHQVNAAAHFQKGGVDAAFSDLMAGAMGCSPSGWMVGEPKIGSSVTFVQSATPGCHGCLGWSPEPGPTDFGILSVPLGLPMYALIPSTAPPDGTTELVVPIPNDPTLVGVDLYFAVVTMNALGELEVSDGFSTVITN